MSFPKWTAHGYETPQNWAFKKDMPAHLRTEAIRLDFGLHGLAWVVRNERGEVLMRSGGRLPTFEFYLSTPGRVIGPQDASAAEYKEWAREWRRACVDARTDQFKAYAEYGGPQV